MQSKADGSAPIKCLDGKINIKGDKVMLSLEDYIFRRKKEDKLDEFDIDKRLENTRICVNYIFEYFNNYLNITEAEERTVLKEEKLERYRRQLHDYDPDVREWLVAVNAEHGNHMNRIVGNILKQEEFFLLYDSDNEFRGLSYDCYSKLIKRYPYLKGQTEMLYKLIRGFHYVHSQREYISKFPSISDHMDEWIETTWAKFNVNLLAFAFDYVNHFFDNEDTWPISHRIKSQESWRKYEYDYRQKGNLFNLDSLYRRMPKKPFIKGRKQEFEILLMYYWLNDMEGDEEDYWTEYLERVIPKLK